MKRILLPALLISLSFCVKAQTKTDSLKPQPVHVKDVVITNPQDADINIDMPAKSSDVTVNGIDPNLIYSAVQHQPDFPGGYNKLKEYFHNSLPVNPVADISGRVILQFVVEKDGSISNIKALRGNNDDSKALAINILKNCPKWNPGMQNGKAVRVYYTTVIDLK